MKLPVSRKTVQKQMEEFPYWGFAHLACTLFGQFRNLMITKEDEKVGFKGTDCWTNIWLSRTTKFASVVVNAAWNYLKSYKFEKQADLLRPIVFLFDPEEVIRHGILQYETPRKNIVRPEHLVDTPMEHHVPGWYNNYNLQPKYIIVGENKYSRGDISPRLRSKLEELFPKSVVIIMKGNSNNSSPLALGAKQKSLPDGTQSSGEDKCGYYEWLIMRAILAYETKFCSEKG
ncbi:MAG: hypothetical protein HOG49_30365 [Candidatus Scalindua sp.]|nr:hypothetical protein [Candidatus Scalindua sp.]